MNDIPTIPRPTTTILFLFVSFGSSPCSSIFATFSGRTFASASFHVLLLWPHEVILVVVAASKSCIRTSAAAALFYIIGMQAKHKQYHEKERKLNQGNEAVCGLPLVHSSYLESPPMTVISRQSMLVKQWHSIRKSPRGPEKQFGWGRANPS